jgi:carboxypeptidase C (cathepsin A)
MDGKAHLLHSEPQPAEHFRYPFRNPAVAPKTTDMAAIGTWHVLQAFLANLPQLDSQIKVKIFNLWTESYGGHYGPAFFKYFSEQNLAVANGTQNGTQLVMDSLGIINGCIDEAIQAPLYPEFAVNNTYGIKAVNDTIYTAMKSSFYDPGKCKDRIAACAASDRSTAQGMSTCSNASNFCRNNVESPYYRYAGRGVYDIRHPYNDTTPPLYFVDYLNLAETQNAIGVNFNYTDSSTSVANDFSSSGDFVYTTFVSDLEVLLNNGVRVALTYGDADYICNVYSKSSFFVITSNHLLRQTNQADNANTVVRRRGSFPSGKL